MAMEMEHPTSPYLAFLESPHQLEVIDQRKLPLTEVKVRLRTLEDVKLAIESMMIRGAPLIGIVGAYGMALAGESNDDLDTVKRQLDAIRPTAVNLAHATSRMLACARKSRENKAQLFDEVKAIAYEEFSACERMATLGASVIPSKPREGQSQISVVHHCNTGGLATFGAGTALGAIMERHNMNPNVFVWVDETRPRLQGAKLTAWELNRMQIPNRIIADGAAGSLLAAGRVDCVLFGADRIVQNGDVVNKVGTYPLSVVARENGVPVYCVAPTSTIDLTILSGSLVKIEERPDSELFEMDGKRFVSADCKGYNPAFDVTPAKYVTAIITEEMICYPPFRESLASAKARALARQQGLALNAAEAVVAKSIVLPEKESEGALFVEPSSSFSTGGAVDKPTRQAAGGGSKRSTGDRLFPPQNDPMEEKRPMRRDDAKPSTRNISFFGDGSADPRMEPAAKDPSSAPTRAKAANIFGTQDDEPAALPMAAVRHYGAPNKSSIVLGDQHSGMETAKPSIRVLGNEKNKSTGIGGDDATAAESNTNRNRLSKRASSDMKSEGSATGSSIVGGGGNLAATAAPSTPTSSKGTASPLRSLTGELDNEQGSESAQQLNSKGHFEAPKREEKERTPIKGHITPHVPEDHGPQGKGHYPATHLKSHVFG